MHGMKEESAVQTRGGSIIPPSQAWIRPPTLDDVITTAIGDHSVEEKVHTMAIVPGFKPSLLATLR